MVAASVFFVYFLTARGLHNVFPFSIFDMYEMRAPSVATRLFVLDSSGHIDELHRFDSFQCNPSSPKLQELSVCGEEAQLGSIPYVARDIQLILDARLKPVSSGEEVKLIARTWRLQETPGPSPFQDCVLARCRAVRSAP